MWRIAICDDNTAEITAVKKLLERYTEQKGLTVQVSVYCDGIELVSAHEDDGAYFDLILLDILMKQLNGIDAALRLRRNGVRTPFIFFTTSRDYAVESYDVQATAYLIKPVDYEKLSAALDKIFSKADCPRLALHIHSDIRYFKYDDILFFESRDHATYVTLESGDSLRCAETLAALEAKLTDDGRFYRCYKGYLINLDHVQQMEDVFILTGGYRVPYRVRDKKKIAADYYRYFLRRNL